MQAVLFAYMRSKMADYIHGSLIFHTSHMLDTLASWPIKGIFEKNTETYVALRGNYSASVQVTDLVEVSNDATSLPECTLKKFFWLEGADFF